MRTTMEPTRNRRLEQRYPATAQAVPLARHAVVELATRLGADPERRSSIALAVTEGCSNVVVHAYRQALQRGEMVVRAEGDARRLEVVVSDEGAGMSARTDSPGLGLGVPLMAELAECVEFRPSPSGQGTELHLRFALTP
jgi:anti-sigma regulatory factor (Ser/Thr protein kinase)